MLWRCARKCCATVPGTNLIDAEETVNSIVEDAPELARSEPARTGSAGLVPELQALGVQVQALCRPSAPKDDGQR